MATTLTSAAITTRKAVRYGIYFIVFLMFARMALSVGAFLYKTLVPPRQAPPTVAFGPLPALVFPESPVKQAVSYTLETPTGGLPRTPNQLPVYYIKPPSATLFSADEATSKAMALGFQNRPNQLSQTLYEFVHPSLPKAMEINIVSGDFSVSYNLSSDRSPLQAVPPNEQEAIREASRILSSARSLPEDLSAGRTTVNFVKQVDQQLVPALSLSDAALTRVNFFRKGFGPEDAYQSVTATPGLANVWMLLSGDVSSSRQKQLVFAEYKYYQVDAEQSATYPLKTAEQAYQDLQNGQAFIARFNGAGVTSTKIRNVYLAYYDPNLPNSFYQPVFVFEGDSEFVAYVPAVTSEYYGVE